jgi:transmembrane sensor
VTTVSTSGTDELKATAQGWVVRLASREISEKELAVFEAWLAASDENRGAFDLARATWLNLANVDNLLPQTRVETRRARWPVALAAGIAAVAVCGLLVADSLTRLRADALTATGEVRKFALPDGSVAVLDTDSAVDIAYTPTERRVRLLRGAAWFDVKHNPNVPFVVATDDLRAVAKGTAYAVSRTRDGEKVEVTRGRVEVSVAGHISTLLAGDGLTASAGNVVERKLPATPVAWREERIVVEDATLPEAIAAIGRYHPGHIITLGSLPSTRVSLSLDISEQDRGLTSLAEAQSLERFNITPWLTVLIPR